MIGPTLAQKAAEPSSQCACVARFTIPNDEDTPTARGQRCNMRHIAPPVSIQFRSPVRRVRLRLASIRTIRVVVLMPKTAVHENYPSPRREDQVGFPRQSSTMQSIPVAKAAHYLPHPSLRQGALASDGPHVRATAFYRNSVGHSTVTLCAECRISSGATRTPRAVRIGHPGGLGRATK
jgi:hypothetical protein